jgi:Uncharacterized protein conserved in bacteria (DUF2188)
MCYSPHQEDHLNMGGKGRDRVISKRPDGQWANKRNDADKASSLHRTQKEAIKAGKDMLGNQGGGELITKGEDGKIRSKDTIAPGNDPNPPRDTEH